MIPVRTLTPIWTGGASIGKVDRLRETGIIGSMRWWYEVLVRGVGGYVSDPTSQENSGLDVDAFNALSLEEQHDRLCLHDTGLCDVSRIFGTTNWKRQFRIQVIDRTAHDGNVHNVSFRKDGQERKWFFPENINDKPRSGDFTISIVPLSVDFDPLVIKGLIQFIADWASLGARAQMGFGVIQPYGDRLDTRPLFEHLKGLRGTQTYAGYPSLDDFFFVRFRKKDGRDFVEQDPFLLKYDLRNLFRDSKKIRHFVMGSISKPSYAAKIRMSRPYEHDGVSIIRLWGWIPACYPDGLPISKQEIWKKIYTHLFENYIIEQHVALTPPDGTKTPNGDITSFLATLLNIGEEIVHA
ncbi:MAG: type III-B CRISPR module RAMP protein Cmr1 [Chlorobiaceae bacterium]|nr:type III-B CRISPR module RAMP protein Cmr1 [Chlorobiaceae bacterium]